MGKRRALASVIEQAAQYPELVTDPELLQYSVGIMAYNEAANIGKCLASVLAQRLTRADIEEILVIASGCTDNTAEVVEEFSRIDPRVKLVLQAKREGKAAAVNLCLHRSRSHTV